MKQYGVSAYQLFAAEVKRRFPEVRDFHVDYWAPNVAPIRFDDFTTEYPPVARWKVGNMRHSYVLKPTMHRQHIGGLVGAMLSIAGGRDYDVHVSYEGQEQVIFEAIEASIKGPEAVEALNRRLNPGVQTPDQLLVDGEVPYTAIESCFPCVGGWPGLKGR